MPPKNPKENICFQHFFTSKSVNNRIPITKKNVPIIQVMNGAKKGVKNTINL